MTDLNRKFAFGTTTPQDLGKVIPQERTWPEIASLFEKPHVSQLSTSEYEALDAKGRQREKNTGLFFGGRCDGDQRRAESLISRSIINLDIDYGAEELYEEWLLTGVIRGLQDVAHLAHTTRSSSPGVPRLRVLIPLSRDVSPAEYAPVARAAAEMVDPDMLLAAPESFTPAQGMFYPSVSSDQEYVFMTSGGAWFDADAALSKYPSNEPATWPKAKDESVSVYVPGRVLEHPEDKIHTAPIVTAVHRVFGPWGVMNELLSDKYIPAGERWVPVTATGAPSVRVYDGAFIQSDHATDPARGQHNSFDIVRIHKFGELDEGMDSTTTSPTALPSYKAAVNFFKQFDEIRDELAEIETELATAKVKAVVDSLAEFLGVSAPDISLSTGDDDPLVGLLGVSSAEEYAESIMMGLVKDVFEKVNSAGSFDSALGFMSELDSEVVTDTHREMIAELAAETSKRIGMDKFTAAKAKRRIQPAKTKATKSKSKGLPAWLEPWTFVLSENKMLHTGTCTLVSRDAFNLTFLKEAIEESGVNERGLPLMNAAEVGTIMHNMPTADDLGYDPGEDLFYRRDGLVFANMYRRPVVPTGGYSGDEGVQLLIRLLNDLFPNPTHRDMVLDFMQHVSTKPANKLNYALVVKGAQNEGKSILGQIMRQLAGPNNTSIINSNMLAEKFNSWSVNKTFCFIEELNVRGRNAADVMNDLKPVITNPEIPVRMMYKDAVTLKNFANLYATTNYDDAIVVNRDETRYLVLFTRFRTNAEVREWKANLVKEEGFDYVSKLWEHVQKRPAQFLRFFEEREFSEHYKPSERAPVTEWLIKMAEASRSEEQIFLERAIDSGSKPLLSEEFILWSYAKGELTAAGLGDWAKGRAVANLLGKMGYTATNRTYLNTSSGVFRGAVWTRRTDWVDAEGELSDEGKAELIKRIEQAFPDGIPETP